MPEPNTQRRLWTPSLTAFGGRRSRRTFYYEAFIPPAIAGLELPLQTDVASVVTEAEVAVRSLNETSRRLGSLEVVGRQLLQAEAVASSRIEGLEMSHRRLARAAAAPEHADATARAVLGNLRAMERAIEIGSTARAITVSRLLELHRELFRDTPDAERAGRLRQSQNWLGGREDSPLGADFIPPPEDRVDRLLRDLARLADQVIHRCQSHRQRLQLGVGLCGVPELDAAEVAIERLTGKVRHTETHDDRAEPRAG